MNWNGINLYILSSVPLCEYKDDSLPHTLNMANHRTQLAVAVGFGQDKFEIYNSKKKCELKHENKKIDRPNNDR